MKRALLSSSLLALTAAFVVAPAYAAEKATKADSTKIFATVNGKVIPANRANVLMATQLAQGQTNSPELQAAVREELVTREVLTQEALKKGLDKKTDVQGQLDLTRQEVLVRAYMGDFARSLKISDADVQKEFEGIKAALGDKEYKARHILVEKEGEAKDIIDRLKKGEKFEDLAKASKDPGSKEKGGELGWANKAGYVQPFSAAMVKLEKGKFTEAPVQSQFGWHVIQVDDVRDLKQPPLDDSMKEKIIDHLRKVAVSNQIRDLRAKAKVE